MQSISDYIEHILQQEYDEINYEILATRLQSASHAEKNEFTNILSKLENDIESRSYDSHSIAKCDLLGWVYHHGIGVTPHAEKAYRFLKLAATQGEIHTRKEIKSLLADLEKDANDGNPQALFDMANIYEHGLGPEQDLKKAFSFYQQAAEQNYADAIFKLGVMYTFGHGVEEDFCQAAKCYCKAYKLESLSEKYHPYLRAEMKQLLDKCTDVSIRYRLAMILKDKNILNELATSNRDDCNIQTQVKSKAQPRWYDKIVRVFFRNK